MPDIYVYSSDPGLEALIDKGAVINVLPTADVSPPRIPGEAVLGVIGGVVNDRGAPNIPVELTSGVQDIFASWGGFKSHLGDGSAAGYNGNLAAMLYGLRAPRIVMVPVDLAVRDATLADGDLLYISLTRSDAANGAATVKAGTRIQVSGGAYVVATLEDVSWGLTETGTKTVRFRQVSGTPADLSTVSVFIDAPADANITVNTAVTTVPDAVDAAELLLRYQAAIDALNSTPLGMEANVVVTDRTEATIADYLSTHCADSLSDGIFRICVVAPPVGTTLANARLTSGDGVGRSTLDGEYTVYCHGGWKRAFALDSTLTGPVTFPGQAVLAAAICKTRFEANPAQPSEVFTAYGCAATELTLSKADKVAHFRANIAQPIFERLNGRLVGSYRDGVMADGTKIADKRLRDYLAAGLIATATPYHKLVATTSNREALGEACSAFLSRQVTGERIAGYAVGVEWDAVNEHVQVVCVAQKLGNMDIMTIRLNVTAETVATEAA